MPEADFRRMIETLDLVADRAGMETTRRVATELSSLCREAGDEPGHAGREAAAAQIASMTEADIALLLRFVTTRFHLLNKAEQLNIAAVNRDRERAATPKTPRSDSIADAVHRLAKRGANADSLWRAARLLDIEPTFTAHPTEARRRSILSKQQDLASIVSRLRTDDALLPGERAELESRVERLIHLLLVTDDVRPRRLAVPDEVRNGLYYLADSVWQVIPQISRDLQSASRDVFGEDSVPDEWAEALVRYRSWIGGDRDGNPLVTAEVTGHTLSTLRESAIAKHAEALTELRHELSVSTSWAEPPIALLAAIERYAAYDPGDAETLRLAEPVRLFIDQVRARLIGDDTYTAGLLLADLALLSESLCEMGLAGFARTGKLAELALRVRTFGLRLATLDIRQHSAVHEAAVAELLRIGGASDGYSSLDEAAKLAMLRSELSHPRPLRPSHASITDSTREVLATLRAVSEARERDGDAVRSYIVSMTHDVSDLLELLLLMKETGLYRVCDGGRVESDLDIVPLFETIDDLQRAPDLLREMFSDEVYTKHLDARVPNGDARRFQEVMLGYSDSNKDGGYVMANVSLDVAQAAVAEVCHEAGVELRLFHGRGGSIGRGGGRTNKAILASPQGAHRGKIRFTEQGEVISFRYALPQIAHRHLEQIVGAMLLVTATEQPVRDVPDRAREIVRGAADTSMKAYRDFIDDPAFWPWYTSVTPVAFIGGLPIASRPISRAAPGQGLTFDKIRAIPWNFAWTQMRAGAPGWFGLGASLGGLPQSDLASLREAFATWPFLDALINNAQLELARSRLSIAERYADRAGADPAIIDRLKHEHAAAVRTVLAISGSERLLDGIPHIQEAIEARNPWTDVLNLIQIELLDRARNAPHPSDVEMLRPLLFASINAIAAAMQSTG
ncbi:MAG: phosphoenolpyruvate carboxylase [Planctomycetota bacterium]